MNTQPFALCVALLIMVGLICFAVSAQTQENATVVIQDLRFLPKIVEVVPGGTVVWANEDNVDHTVTSVSPLFDSGVIAPGEEFSFTFNEEGTYSYICTLFPKIRGQVIVAETDAVESQPPEGTAMIAIEKSVNDWDVDGPPGVEIAGIFLWPLITISITNPGDVALTNVQVSDNLHGTLSGFRESKESEAGFEREQNGILEPGEDWTLFIEEQIEEGQYEDIVNVTSEDPDGNIVNASDVAYYYGRIQESDADSKGSIEIHSDLSGSGGVPSEVPPGPNIVVGSSVGAVFMVTNTGTVPYADVQLSSDSFRAISSPDGFDGPYILKPGDTWGFEEYFHTIEGEQQVTIAITALDPEGNQIEESIMLYYTGVVEEETPAEEMTQEE
jgi:plastocyanin